MSEVKKYQLSPEERSKYPVLKQGFDHSNQVPTTPNEIKVITVPFSTAWTALVAIYLSLEYEYWENEKVFRTLSQKCYQNKYNGQWKTVQDLLETELQSPKQFEEEFIKIYGPREFFGNLLPAAERMRRMIKVQSNKIQKEKPVKYPQFRRGYRDKGHRVEDHERHGIPDYSEDPERQDRRGQVYHPLLREVEIYPVEGYAKKTRPRREEKP